MQDPNVPYLRRDKMCQHLLGLSLPTIRYKGSKVSKQNAASNLIDNRFAAPKTPGQIDDRFSFRNVMPSSDKAAGPRVTW
jgi:hypothetical protein